MRILPLVAAYDSIVFHLHGRQSSDRRNGTGQYSIARRMDNLLSGGCKALRRIRGSVGVGVFNHFPWFALLPVHLQRATVFPFGDAVVVRVGAESLLAGVDCRVPTAIVTRGGCLQCITDCVLLADPPSVGLAGAMAMAGC